MPLYEFQDSEGHVIEHLCALEERPDEIEWYCNECGKSKVFKRILSTVSFWGDFGTASSESYEKRKKKTKPGIEKSSNSVKINGV